MTKTDAGPTGQQTKGEALAKAAGAKPRPPRPARRRTTSPTGFAFRWFLIYAAALLVVAPTLTILPGYNPLNGLPSPALWDDFEDLVRIATSAIIHLIPFFAITKAAGAIRGLQDERKYAEQVRDRANQLLPSDDLKRLAATGSMELIAFKRLFGDLSPGNTLSGHRLLEEVMIKALSGRFEPTAVLLAPYREILGMRVSSLATIQRVALQSGIFCTFIGLTLAFQNGQFMAGSGEQTISRMLDSLGLAFATSIAGLLASLTIILISSPVRSSYFGAMRALEEMIAATYEVGRRLPQDVYFVNQLADVASAVGRSQESMQAVAMRTDRLTGAISDGVDKVAAVKTSFDQVIATIRADQQQLAKEFKEYVAALDPNLLRAQVSTLSEGMTKDVSASLEKVAATINATNALHESARERTNRIEQLIVQMARLHLDNREDFRTIRREVAELDPAGEPAEMLDEPPRKRPPRRKTEAGWLPSFARKLRR